MNAKSLLIAVKSYAKASGCSVRTVATKATGSGDTFDRLERGCDITLGRANLIVQWLHERWPEGLDWPADIQRPKTAPPKPAALHKRKAA